MVKLVPEASVTDIIGKEFGPYTLVQRLGVGGMAETFEAIRHGRSGFEQRVCLKLVRPGFQDNIESIQLFEREARLAAKLQHSHIVGVIDFGEIQGTIYMALELVDGADLQVLLDARKCLSPEHVALIGHDLATALEHAHNPAFESSGESEGAGTGIIHRDISPSNVLISRYGEVKLTDFGLASLAAGGSRQSEIRGKFPYMAPERLRADPLDGGSDLFSLGVVLFEALAGRRPYEGGNDPATIMLIMEGDHPALMDLAPGTPHELCRIIETLIEADRQRRPETAGALAEQLDPFVPSPAARRKLGKMAMDARSHRSAQKPISSRRLAQSELPKRADVSGGEGRGSLVGPPSWRRLAKLAALMTLVIGIGIAAVAFWPSAEDGSAINAAPPRESQTKAASDPASDTEPSTAPAGVPADVDTTVEAEARSPLDTPAQTDPVREPGDGDGVHAAVTPTRAARLTVLVYPWGSVWINGKPKGSAPLKNASLKAGLYNISAGRDGPSQTRSVRLREGQRRTVRFNLEE